MACPSRGGRGPSRRGRSWRGRSCRPCAGRSPVVLGVVLPSAEAAVAPGCGRCAARRSRRRSTSAAAASRCSSLTGLTGWPSRSQRSGDLLSAIRYGVLSVWRRKKVDSSRRLNCPGARAWMSSWMRSLIGLGGRPNSAGNSDCMRWVTAARSTSGRAGVAAASAPAGAAASGSAGATLSAPAAATPSVAASPAGAAWAAASVLASSAAGVSCCAASGAAADDGSDACAAVAPALDPASAASAALAATPAGVSMPAPAGAASATCAGSSGAAADAGKGVEETAPSEPGDAVASVGIGASDGVEESVIVNGAAAAPAKAKPAIVPS